MKKLILILSFLIFHQTFGVDSTTSFSNLNNEVKFSWTSALVHENFTSLFKFEKLVVESTPNVW